MEIWKTFSRVYFQTVSMQVRHFHDNCLTISWLMIHFPLIEFFGFLILKITKQTQLRLDKWKSCSYGDWWPVKEWRWGIERKREREREDQREMMRWRYGGHLWRGRAEKVNKERWEIEVSLEFSMNGEASKGRDTVGLSYSRNLICRLRTRSNLENLVIKPYRWATCLGLISLGSSCAFC